MKSCIQLPDCRLTALPIEHGAVVHSCGYCRPFQYENISHCVTNEKQGINKEF